MEAILESRILESVGEWGTSANQTMMAATEKMTKKMRKEDL